MTNLKQEYDTESHRLSLMIRSQDEIKKLTDQLDTNDVRLKLQKKFDALLKDCSLFNISKMS